MRFYRKTFAGFILLCSLCVNTVLAGLQNGGFETGNLTNWNTQGSIEVLQSSNFSPSIPVPEGDHYVLISNIDNSDIAPDNSPFTDADGDGSSDNDQTVLSQTFACVDGKLCFKWSWLSEEEDQPDMFDDIFYVRLDDTIILSGSVDKGYEGSSPFLNVSTDSSSYFVSSSGLTNGSSFNDGRSAFAQFCSSIAAGTHTIYFVVADQGNHGFDSGLIIDNITVEESTEVTLSLFTANSDNNNVTLTWETATEIDNAGFSIYRSKHKNGAYTKINEELIAANGSETEGANYSYEDTPPRHGTYYYKLEDVDSNGVSTMHGPVKGRIRNGASEAKRR